MKILPGHLLLAALLHLSLMAPAQDSSAYFLYDHEYGDSVSRYVQKLMKGKKDTIIRFDLPHTHSNPDFSYIFFREGVKIISVHYSSYQNSQGNVFDYMSDPQVLEQDTIFTWLAKHLNEVNTEDIYPFITRVKENNYPDRYVQWQSLYSPVYRIVIYTPEGRVWKNIDVEHLEKQNRHQMFNLNYDQNINSKLWQLFLMLERHCLELKHRMD